MPRLEAKLRRCFGPESAYYDRNPELADWMETNLPDRLYGLSFCTFYLAAHSHQQRAGEPKPSDSPASRVVGIFPSTPSPHYDSSPLSSSEIHEDWLIGKQYLSLVDFKPQENPIQITLSQITEKCVT